MSLWGNSRVMSMESFQFGVFRAAPSDPEAHLSAGAAAWGWGWGWVPVGVDALRRTGGVPSGGGGCGGGGDGVPCITSLGAHGGDVEGGPSER